MHPPSLSASFAEKVKGLEALTRELTLLANAHDVSNEEHPGEFSAGLSRLSEELDRCTAQLSEKCGALKAAVTSVSPSPRTPSAIEDMLELSSDPSLERFFSSSSESVHDLLDGLLSEASSGLDVIDIEPSPLEQMLADTPLVPEPSLPVQIPADHLTLSDLLPDLIVGSEEGYRGAHGFPAERVAAAEPPSLLSERVRSWHDEGGTNIRTLLSSLHMVAPPGAKWKETNLSQLLSEATLHRAYLSSVRAVHPDKLPPSSRDLGQVLFDRLNQAWKLYKGRSL